MNGEMNGKGSKRRPTDEKRFGANWTKIFGVKSCQQDDRLNLKHPKNCKKR